MYFSIIFLPKQSMQVLKSKLRRYKDFIEIESLSLIFPLSWHSLKNCDPRAMTAVFRGLTRRAWTVFYHYRSLFLILSTCIYYTLSTERIEIINIQSLCNRAFLLVFSPNQLLKHPVSVYNCKYMQNGIKSRNYTFIS